MKGKKKHDLVPQSKYRAKTPTEICFRFLPGRQVNTAGTGRLSKGYCFKVPVKLWGPQVLSCSVPLSHPLLSSLGDSVPPASDDSQKRGGGGT